MISKIAVLGGCATRDVFNSKINQNYKQYFKIVSSLERSSIISLMDKPIYIENENIINSYNNHDLDNFGTKCLKRDFSKEFLLELKNNKIDYLIIDNLFEARFGILCYENHIITNNTWNLPSTSFYKSLKDYKTISITDNPKKYLKLYKKNFSLFYDYIKNECNDIKIILNRVCGNDKYLDYDGTLKAKYEDYCNKINPGIYRLNRCIEDNFEIDVIELNMLNYPNDSNHIWGSGSAHFIPEYYEDFTKKLNKIIKKDNYINNLNEVIQKQHKEIENYKKKYDDN